MKAIKDIQKNIHSALYTEFPGNSSSPGSLPRRVPERGLYPNTFQNAYNSIGLQAKVVSIFLMLTLIANIAFSQTATAGAKYLAVVDSGSSGSRLYLFELTHENNRPKVKEIELKNNTVEPGLYSLSKAPDRIGEYFKPLLKSLKAGMVSVGLKSDQISFYVFSTAGMRIASPLERERLYKILKNYIESEKFNFVDVRMIKGHFEGLFAWITVNYLMHGFTKNVESFGVLDMGGGSTQIAFETGKIGLDIYPVKIGSKTYDIYSKSYLGLGMDFAKYQFSNAPACWPTGYPLPSSDTKAVADFARGVHEISVLIDFIHRVNATVIPKIADNMEFIGISGFYNILTAKALNLGSIFSINDIQTAGTNLSKLTWDELVQKYPNDPYLYSYLLNLELYAALLQYGYNFKQDKKIKAYGKINGVSVNWALGAAIYLLEGNPIN
ncbi:MAG: hypothetical protein HQM10_13885 [Candidatus Riflebacteria bacterium]|nr:hypothetical protein [Candidatus Riflebacteria bacterium]